MNAVELSLVSFVWVRGESGVMIDGIASGNEDERMDMSSGWRDFGPVKWGSLGDGIRKRRSPMVRGL